MTIKQYIKKFVDESFDDERLPFPIADKIFAKNEVICKIGEIESNIYYIEVGIIQVSIPNDGETRILDFFFSDTFCSSYTSLLKQIPSDVQLLAITECVVKVIKYSDLMFAFQDSLIANKLGRIEAQRQYLRKVKREKDFLTKSAEERYKDIFNENPKLINQIPVNKIARYLGIHPESLSRIRKQIIS